MIPDEKTKQGYGSIPEPEGLGPSKTNQDWESIRASNRVPDQAIEGQPDCQVDKDSVLVVYEMPSQQTLDFEGPENTYFKFTVH